MKRMIAALLAAALAAGSLSACEKIGWQEEETTPPYPVTVGNVTIEKKPRTVGSLSPTLTKLLIDLGYQDRIVGFSDDDEIPGGVTLSDLTDEIAAAEAEGTAASSGPEAGASVPGGGDNSSEEVPSENSAPTENGDEAESGETTPDPAPSGETGSGSDSSITISIPEDWDGKTPLPTEPTLYGTMGTALSPDMTKIGILKPEIIFTALPFTKAQMDRLDEVNIKVVVLPAVKTLEELKQRILELVALMDGRQESEGRGQELIDEMTRQLDYIASQVPSERQTFLYVCGLDPLIATGDTFESELLSMVADNLAGDGTGYTLPEEELAGLDPDVILYSAPLERAHIEQSELFKDKKAVADGAVIEINRNVLLEQTTQVVETVRNIAKQFYPGVDFDEPEPEETSGLSSEG